MSFCTFQHIILHSFQCFANFSSQFIQCNYLFFSGVTANDYCLTCFNILRTDFHTKRNTTDFLFTELPAGALVGIVYFYFITSFNQAALQFSCFFQYACFMLSDGNNHNLNRCNSGRQYQTAVITVNHDDRTDDACGHTP